MATNSIGSLDFICFYGEPPVYQEQIERLEYPGADGARYRKTGKAGGPFTLESCVDVLDIEDGRVTMGAYAALVGAGDQNLVWRNRHFIDENLKVVVLGVRQKELRVVGAFAGALDPASTARLRAEWTLDFRKV